MKSNFAFLNTFNSNKKQRVGFYAENHVYWTTLFYTSVISAGVIYGLQYTGVLKL